jgi:hypothetical protein
MTLEEKKISFNQAWKDFLLIRPFTRSSQIVISRNADKIVTAVRAGEFKLLKKGTEQYVIDDVSCTGIILAYPRKIVDDAINEKIFLKLIGKPLSDEKLEIIRKKLDWDAKKTASRLGCANTNEVRQAILEKDFWEVLFSLHQLIEYRLRKLLLYKCSQINANSSEIIFDSLMQKICDDITTFKHLVEIGYLTGTLNQDERKKGLSFNAIRDSIAHKLLKNEVTDKLLKKVCSQGVKLLDSLENALQRIIPKPKMIMMDSFLIHEFIE